MNILLTSVGRRTYLVEYFKNELKSYQGAVHASNSVMTFSLKKADKFVITPQNSEIIIFSSHLIHGIAQNNNKDITRVALEFKLFEDI